MVNWAFDQVCLVVYINAEFIRRDECHQKGMKNQLIIFCLSGDNKMELETWGCVRLLNNYMVKIDVFSKAMFF